MKPRLVRGFSFLARRLSIRVVARGGALRAQDSRRPLAPSGTVPRHHNRLLKPVLFLDETEVRVADERPAHPRPALVKMTPVPATEVQAFAAARF